MRRLYIAILIASVGMAQAAMIPQEASDKFKTLQEVADPIRNKSMLNGFMLGMAQQAVFFSACHAVKGPYAFSVYAGSSFSIGCMALRFALTNFAKVMELQRIDEQSARIVHRRMYPLLWRFHETKMQQKFVTFLPTYKAARQGTLSEAQLESCDGSMMSNAYNDLLTQYAKKSFQGWGYVLSAACGPTAALMFLTCCTFGLLPCTMEGYELQSSSGVNLRDFMKLD